MRVGQISVKIPVQLSVTINRVRVSSRGSGLYAVELVLSVGRCGLILRPLVETFQKVAL